MANNNPIETKHFTLEQLADGVFACIHRPGGAAFSNSGIIDLGDRTIIVDAFDTKAAGCDLRQTAEALFERPVDTIVLTHPHSDHWMGASAFDADTSLVAHRKTREVSIEWGTEIMEDFKHPEEWKKWIKEIEQQLQDEQDAQARISLENSLAHTRYVFAEMAEFQPRYADQTYDESFSFQSSKRIAKLLSLGRGHSENDATLLLDQDQIAFIGDIGFFDTQPFLGFCDIELYREQLRYFLNSEYQLLVPGHGPVGNKENHIAVQLEYMDVIEDLVGKVVQTGGSLEEALQITLPSPFDEWLIGGMGRFNANVQYLFKHLGGVISEENR